MLELAPELVATRAGGEIVSRSPIDGKILGRVAAASADDAGVAVLRAADAFKQWRVIPAPRRGELVRRFAEVLRARKSELAELVTSETGKIRAEALGEVQEMIDIADFAVGLSRQLYGLTIASERPGHRMMEQWHPLGPVAVISAFNFPVAVWAWNAMLAWVCGNPTIWKPSEKTPLCALACQKYFEKAATGMADVPAALSQVIIGDASVGEALAASPAVPLVSATGSTRMGKSVAATVAARLGRSLLELGGNNALILTPSADLELALRAIVFAAVGTAGQRCTTLRRLIVHESIAETVVAKLKTIYAQLRIGDPRESTTLIGPLIDAAAYAAMQHALSEARHYGGEIFGGERVTNGVPEGGCYVRPAIVTGLDPHSCLVKRETFAPILYILPCRDFDEAVAIQNEVPQGLSSAVFTGDMREAELFMGPAGSDCGIANVNIGTSGAEIGGAFGGDKDTGGGRESGSDAWKAYMRRTTNTINYSRALPLAQGIRFDV